MSLLYSLHQFFHFLKHGMVSLVVLCRKYASFLVEICMNECLLSSCCMISVISELNINIHNFPKTSWKYCKMYVFFPSLLRWLNWIKLNSSTISRISSSTLANKRHMYLYQKKVQNRLNASITIFLVKIFTMWSFWILPEPPNEQLGHSQTRPWEYVQIDPSLYNTNLQHTAGNLLSDSITNLRETRTQP